MAAPELSEEKMIEALLAEARFDYQIDAARFLKLSKSTFHSRLERAKEALKANRITLPVEYPSGLLHDGIEEPLDDLKERLRKDFHRKQKKAEVQKWFAIKVNETLPYGILLVGDPHLGDSGSNFPLLEQHLQIANRPYIYGVNIGDSTNNWVGRLMRLYADQETSSASERRLIKWLMTEAGVRWLCWILGNHDEWREGGTIQRLIGGPKVPIIDWRAQFRVVHPSGIDVRIDASHGRKGKSIWNELHATLRAAKLGESADLYVTGHTHNYACQDLEIADNGTNTWLVQVSGYKQHDRHALVNGFPEFKRGASVLAIIDPRKSAPRPVLQCFEDVEHGADNTVIGAISSNCGCGMFHQLLISSAV